MENKQEVKPFDCFRKEGASKLTYCARNVRVTPAKEIWPHRDDCDNIVVLVGEYYVHDEWFPLRTSMIIHQEGNTYETRNSIYQVIS